VANVQIGFESATMAVITASRATEEKIRTLAVTQPDAYIVLDYAEQDIRVHRRAAQEYTLNRESIRYRRASFVEHVQVHKDNPLKLEILHLARAVKRARAYTRSAGPRAGSPSSAPCSRPSPPRGSRRSCWRGSSGRRTCSARAGPTRRSSEWRRGRVP